MAHGDEQTKCRDCDGEGTLNIRGSLKTCRICQGTGTISVLDEARRVLREFQVEGHFAVSREHSVFLKFRGYDYRDVENRILQVLNALTVGKIKTRIVFPVF